MITVALADPKVADRLADNLAQHVPATAWDRLIEEVETARDVAQRGWPTRTGRTRAAFDVDDATRGQAALTNSKPHANAQQFKGGGNVWATVVSAPAHARRAELTGDLATIAARTAARGPDGV